MAKLFFAILIGKIIYFLTRLLKTGGGSAAPGLYALKIDPELVVKLSSKIPQNIIITGTNGKTTTSRMASLFAKSQNLKVIRNSTGSNLERGIASTLISHFNPITLKMAKTDLAIWEVDEAAFNSLALKIKSSLIVFLNAFRDQLDRYGEVDSVVKKWQETLKKLPPETKIFVNGDDNNTYSLKKFSKGLIKSFGIPSYTIKDESLEKSSTKKQLDLEAEDIKQISLDQINFTLIDQKQSYKVSLPVPGIYHIYDFLAAYAIAKFLGLKPPEIIESLKKYSPAFGRVESINIDGHRAYILLIKNPAGANQVFLTVAPDLKKGDKLLFALNDNFADGTDVSWIWDAEFEQLAINNYQLSIICSGSRSYDLALRLKYAGAKDIVIESNLKKALTEAKRDLKGRLFIFPTYTALLQLQAHLSQAKLKKMYWEDQA